MITGNHRNEIHSTQYNPEFAFCEFYVNNDGTKRPNKWTPPLHKITSENKELLWLYFERAEISYNDIKYYLDHQCPENIEESLNHYKKFDFLSAEEQRREAYYLMQLRQYAITAYEMHKEYLEGLVIKLQFATKGEIIPKLPTFEKYEYDLSFLPEEFIIYKQVELSDFPFIESEKSIENKVPEKNIISSTLPLGKPQSGGIINVSLVPEGFSLNIGNTISYQYSLSQESQKVENQNSLKPKINENKSTIEMNEEPKFDKPSFIIYAIWSSGLLPKKGEISSFCEQIYPLFNIKNRSAFFKNLSAAVRNKDFIPKQTPPEHIHNTIKEKLKPIISVYQ